MPADMKTILTVLISIFSHVLGYKYLITQTESLKFVPNSDIHRGLCGNSVDISSNFIIIGCPHKNNSDTTRTGSAVIYTFNGSSWDRGIDLFSNQKTISDGYGLSVAISVMFAVVGSPYDSENNISMGSVYIYSYDGMVWLPDGVRVTPEDGGDGDRFGYTVTMYMDTIAVGSPFATTGSVYIFSNVDGRWRQQTKLKPNDIFRVKHFGSSITMHGEYLIVGTHSENSQLHDAGIIFIYKYTVNDYELQATLYALKAMDLNGFGNTIDNDNGRIVIGSPIENENGIVYVYIKEDNNGWALETELEPVERSANLSDSSWFGNAVSISGTFMVIGSPRNNNRNMKFGCFYLFRLIKDKWILAKRLIKSDEKKVNKFGSPVAMDDGRVIVGSVDNDGDGAAYLFNIYD